MVYKKEDEEVGKKKRSNFFIRKKGVSFSLNFVNGFQYFRGIQFARNDGIQHLLLLLHLELFFGLVFSTTQEQLFQQIIHHWILLCCFGI